MLQKLANIAQILSLLPGCYGAYGMWITLHPDPPPPSSAEKAEPVSRQVIHPGYVVSFISFAALFAAGGAMQIIARKKSSGGLIPDAIPDKNLQKQYEEAKQASAHHEGRCGELQKALGTAQTEIAALTERFTKTSNDLRSYKEKDTTREAQERLYGDILGRAPQLWIDYIAKKDHQMESLRFSKDGGAVKNIKAGPLVWNIKEERPITLHNVIGILRTDPIDCKFTALEETTLGGMTRVWELPDLIREMMTKFDSNAQPSVEITYEDLEGHRFCRTFVLSIDPYDRIVWEPDPVKLLI